MSVTSDTDYVSIDQCPPDGADTHPYVPLTATRESTMGVKRVTFAPRSESDSDQKPEKMSTEGAHPDLVSDQYLYCVIDWRKLTAKGPESGDPTARTFHRIPKSVGKWQSRALAAETELAASRAKLSRWSTYCSNSELYAEELRRKIQEHGEYENHLLETNAKQSERTHSLEEQLSARTETARKEATKSVAGWKKCAELANLLVDSSLATIHGLADHAMSSSTAEWFALPPLPRPTPPGPAPPSPFSDAGHVTTTTANGSVDTHAPNWVEPARPGREGAGVQPFGYATRDDQVTFDEQHRHNAAAFSKHCTPATGKAPKTEIAPSEVTDDCKDDYGRAQPTPRKAAPRVAPPGPAPPTATRRALTLPPETTRQPDPTDPSCSLVIREPVANRVSFDPSAAIIPPLPSDSGTDQPQPTGTSIPDAWHGDSAYEDDAATTAYWKHQYNLRGEIIASQQHRIDRHWDELRRYESALQASESRVSQLDHALQQSEQDREEGRWGLEETLARLAHVDAELRAAHAFSEFCGGHHHEGGEGGDEAGGAYSTGARA
ncbi:uncharacterized protein MKK02DRAFT_33090 [Dioszegia hungarica]|uniref:Uncharacterized protein n=1 Tax=Dioszegia hungarica TaxID=4972 RepID=A0AA38HAB3_9TREE|nr:uncharacterized protein MKK02DRAFT_33090 [Dioszegia hungarica]KAI9635734.1 hypothetical protein MKK02DRAFT_33090 [Dioszegia hungarica]